MHKAFWEISLWHEKYFMKSAACRSLEKATDISDNHFIWTIPKNSENVIWIAVKPLWGHLFDWSGRKQHEKVHLYVLYTFTQK